MKYFKAISAGKGVFGEEPTPKPQKGFVLVKICYCGICGTDYALFGGKSSFIKNGQATYPIRLGHEWSGIVEEIGEGVTKVKKGDRVVGDNYVSCGKCEACLRHDYNFCTGRKHVGTIDPCWPGAFAEYFLIPERHVYKIADTFSLKHAALCEPFSVAYGGIKKMDLTPSSVVVVIGTGCIGLAAAVLAKIRGAGQIYLVGRNKFKLAIAEKLGITAVIDSSEYNAAERLKELTGGKLADFVLECSGNPVTVNQSLELSAQKSFIAAIGFYENPLNNFEIDTLVAKEIKIQGIMGEYGNLEAVSGILADSDEDLEAIITNTVDFDRLPEALAPESFSRVIKTIVKIGEEN